MANKQTTGPSCVSPSRYVGIPLAADDRMKGITGAPMVSNGMTTAVKYSDSSEMGLTRKLNSANDAARRTGTVFMPTRGGD
ncbi:MAG TPA: hypothetical protein VFB02_16460 [Bradyrhizobium sp.]|nr:hypothetical protein [Bradyrhizobium sp.]